MTVTKSNRTTQERRARLAAEFRARLVAELAPGGSAARDSLVDNAVSCYVEIAELTSRFLRARAGASDMERCSRARSTLVRTLAVLGVTPKSASEANVSPKLDDWLRDWRARKKPNGEANPAESGPDDES